MTTTRPIASTLVRTSGVGLAAGMMLSVGLAAQAVPMGYVPPTVPAPPTTLGTDALCRTQPGLPLGDVPRLSAKDQWRALELSGWDRFGSAWLPAIHATFVWESDGMCPAVLGPQGEVGICQIMPSHTAIIKRLPARPAKTDRAGWFRYTVAALVECRKLAEARNPRTLDQLLAPWHGWRDMGQMPETGGGTKRSTYLGRSSQSYAWWRAWRSVLLTDVGAPRRTSS